MVKWRYDEFFDLLEMPCTGFFFPIACSWFFILFYFIFSFFLLTFFFLISFLPDHILQRWYTYLRFAGQEMVPIFTIPHTVTVWLPRGPPGRGCKQLRRGTVSFLVSGILFIVEKMHWLSTGEQVCSPQSCCWAQPWPHLPPRRSALGAPGILRRCLCPGGKKQLMLLKQDCGATHSLDQIRSGQIIPCQPGPLALWGAVPEGPDGGVTSPSAGTVSIMLAWFAPCLSPGVGKTCV